MERYEVRWRIICPAHRWSVVSFGQT